MSDGKTGSTGLGRRDLFPLAGWASGLSRRLPINQVKADLASKGLGAQGCVEIGGEETSIEGVIDHEGAGRDQLAPCAAGLNAGGQGAGAVIDGAGATIGMPKNATADAGNLVRNEMGLVINGDKFRGRFADHSIQVADVKAAGARSAGAGVDDPVVQGVRCGSRPTWALGNAGGRMQNSHRATGNLGNYASNVPFCLSSKSSRSKGLPVAAWLMQHGKTQGHLGATELLGAAETDAAAVVFHGGPH